MISSFTRSRAARAHVAAAITTLLVLLALVPLFLGVVPLATSIVAFGQQIADSESGVAALRAATSAGDTTLLPVPSGLDDLDPGHIVSLVQDYGSDAMALMGSIADTTTRVAIYALVFVLGTYAQLAYASQIHEWFVQRIPLDRRLCDRMCAAFVETGKGLLIGLWLTALIQGLLAGLAYAVLGIGQAAVLGLLTAVAAVIPIVGTALVWIPVTGGLMLSGRRTEAAIMLACGFGIATVDNLVRPVLAKYGQLNLPAFIVFSAMLGGLFAFGPGGLLLGPLLVRLAVEGMNIQRERSQSSCISDPLTCAHRGTPTPSSPRHTLDSLAFGSVMNERELLHPARRSVADTIAGTSPPEEGSSNGIATD